MSEHTYKFDVKMTCGGCSGAITRVLKRLEGEGGIKSYDVNLEKQSAEVITTDDSLTYDKVLGVIKKTGKEVRAGWADGESKPVEVAV